MLVSNHFKRQIQFYSGNSCGSWKVSKSGEFYVDFAYDFFLACDNRTSKIVVDLNIRRVHQKEKGKLANIFVESGIST